MSYHFFLWSLLRDTDLTLAHAGKSRLRRKLGDTVLGIDGCKSQSTEKSKEHHVEVSGENSTAKQRRSTTFYTLKWHLFVSFSIRLNRVTFGLQFVCIAKTCFHVYILKCYLVEQYLMENAIKEPNKLFFGCKRFVVPPKCQILYSSENNAHI